MFVTVIVVNWIEQHFCYHCSAIHEICGILDYIVKQVAMELGILLTLEMNDLHLP